MKLEKKYFRVDVRGETGYTTIDAAIKDSQKYVAQGHDKSGDSTEEGEYIVQVVRLVKKSQPPITVEVVK